MTIDLRLSCLGPEAASSYRELRLLALRLHPEAFGASFEEEAGLSETRFAERLSAGPVFGAWLEDRLVGCAGLAQREKVKLKHKAILWGMFVRHEMQGSGIGKRLLDATLEYTRAICEEVLLTVVDGNEPAITLYTRAGFEEYGREPNALKINGRYYPELMMRLPLESR